MQSSWGSPKATGDRHGQVVYDLREDFGADPARVREPFRCHLERFAVVNEVEWMASAEIEKEVDRLIDERPGRELPSNEKATRRSQTRESMPDADERQRDAHIDIIDPLRPSAFSKATISP